MPFDTIILQMLEHKIIVRTHGDEHKRTVPLRSCESGKTSELLTSYNNTISADDYAAKNINFTYSYDDNGNITEIRQNGTLTNKYYYDEAGQVIREDYVQQEKTITYSYDNGGNIVSKNEYAYTDSEVLGDVVTTNTFSYSNSSWKDQLTSFNGEDITYDALGNPVSYGDYITYTWNGRQLLEYKDSDPGDYLRCVYTYDADGLRTRKLVYRQKSSTDTTEYIAQQYDYVWKDGILDSEKYVIYNNNGSVYQSIVYKYFYDEYSSPIGIALWIDGEKNGNYWYIKNAQGDVTAVYCEGSGIVINYYYDAYGNMKATAGDKGGAAGTIGAIIMALYNSVTYRGYYFDVHTNLYYLQSRYYSPTWGRFINADDVEYLGVSGTALSYNLYAYCENDAVNEVDPSGYFALSDLKKLFLNVISLMQNVINNLGKKHLGIWVEGSYLCLKVSTFATIVDALITAGNVVTSAVKKTAWKGICQLAIKYVVDNPQIFKKFLKDTVFDVIATAFAKFSKPISQIFLKALKGKVKGAVKSWTKKAIKDQLLGNFKLYQWIDALTSPGFIIGTILDIIDGRKWTGKIEIKIK